MREKLPEDLRALAQPKVAASRSEDVVGDLDVRLWQYIFWIVLGLLFLALVLVPGAPLERKMYAIVHGLVAQQHNVILDGKQVPLCARNIGIYGSFLLTATYLLGRKRSRAGRLPPGPITAVLGGLALLMAVDGFNSLFAEMGRATLYPPRNDLRIVTGVGLGVGLAVVVLFCFNRALRHNLDPRQRVLTGWRELGGLLALSLALILGMSHMDSLFWPLAWLSFLGIISEIYVINVLLASLLMGYHRSVTQLGQLAYPATVALIPTLLLVGGLALLRFWMERQGWLIA